jgi:hypothetical protein
MAQYNSVYTFTTPASTITLNAASGDTYLNDASQCSGLDGVELRTSVDPASQTDGAHVHPSFEDARHITLGGIIYITSSATDSGIMTARNSLEAGLIAACRSLKTANGTLAWTPTGGSARSITVRCDILPTFTGSWVKSYLFGLVAADPAQ